MEAYNSNTLKCNTDRFINLRNGASYRIFNMHEYFNTRYIINENGESVGVKHLLEKYGNDFNFYSVGRPFI